MNPPDRTHRVCNWDIASDQDNMQGDVVDDDLTELASATLNHPVPRQPSSPVLRSSPDPISLQFTVCRTEPVW